MYTLSLPPGVSRNGTDYQNKGRWYSTQLVRFLEGMILPVGGWVALEYDEGSSGDAGDPTYDYGSIVGLVTETKDWGDLT